MAEITSSPASLMLNILFDLTSSKELIISIITITSRRNLLSRKDATPEIV